MNPASLTAGALATICRDLILLGEPWKVGHYWSLSSSMVTPDAERNNAYSIRHITLVSVK